MKSLWQVCVVLVSCSGGQDALYDENWKPDVQRARSAFEVETRMPLRPGFRIEPTVFPGYYAVRSGVPGEPSAYFREDMGWLGNVRGRGWTIRSASESSPEGQIRWLQEQIKHIPLDRLILVKRKTPVVAVIWSAPDCPFCRRLEMALERDGVSVYVAPVGLSEEGFRSSAELYCAQDPSMAWSAAMQGTLNIGAPKPSCTYPRDMLMDLGFFLGGGRIAVPIVIFANGATLTGWDDGQGLARLREEITQGRSFPSREMAGVK